MTYVINIQIKLPTIPSPGTKPHISALLRNPNNVNIRNSVSAVNRSELLYKLNVPR